MLFCVTFVRHWQVVRLMIRKIPPILAAVMMGKGPNFIRIGIQRGLLPFGVCDKSNEKAQHGRHSYYISPKQFMDYTGFTEDDIRATAEREGVTL